jgi:hypothetical protein
MKRCWNEQELIEHWTLFKAEEALLTNRTERERMGVAILLSFSSTHASLDTTGMSPARSWRLLENSCRARRLPGSTMT